MKDVQIAVNKTALSLEYNENNFVTYHRKIRGLSNKSDYYHCPLIININPILYASPEILHVNLGNCTLGASYFRENMAKLGVNVFVKIIKNLSRSI
jgi:hypothetical protein